MYIFMVLISAAFLGMYDVFKKISLKKSDVNETLFFYCLCGFLVSLVFIVDALSLEFVNILFILIKSLIIVINWFLVAKSMKKLDVGIVVGFSLLNTILVVFGSSLFFKENITWIHFLSLLFISVGIILITLLQRKEDKEKIENNYKYIILLIIGSLLGASSGLLDKYMLNYRDMSSGAILTWFMFFNTLIYGIIYYIKNKKLNLIQLKNNYWLIFTGIAIAVSDIVYYYAITMQGAQISLISIIRKSSVIVATILASILLKEKKLFKKLGILVLMIIGVSLPIIF